jgi:hypothetical protein
MATYILTDFTLPSVPNQIFQSIHLKRIEWTTENLIGFWNKPSTERRVRNATDINHRLLRHFHLSALYEKVYKGFHCYSPLLATFWSSASVEWWPWAVIFTIKIRACRYCILKVWCYKMNQFCNSFFEGGRGHDKEYHGLSTMKVMRVWWWRWRLEGDGGEWAMMGGDDDHDSFLNCFWLFLSIGSEWWPIILKQYSSINSTVWKVKRK